MNFRAWRSYTLRLWPSVGTRLRNLRNEFLHIVELRNMMTKFFGLWSHPGSSGAKALQGIGHEKFESFYTSLGTQIYTLENQLVQESHFSLGWILSAMVFVRSLHASVYALIEEVWLPMRKIVGIDVVETYFDVTVKLLEMCNYLRDGVSELEYFQLSLEHCLESLGGLVETVALVKSSDESVVAKKQLKSCRLELEKLESKTSPNLWLEMRSKWKGKNNGGEKKLVEPEVSPLERSHSAVPSPSIGKKAFLIVQVMTDVQVVMTFISSLLLWVLTDTSEPFSAAHAFDGYSFAPGTASKWSAALLSLRDRIENSELKHKKSNCALSVKEIRVVHEAVRDLMEQMENVAQQSAEAGGTDRSEILRTAAEQTRGKLHDMTQIADRLSLVTQDTFSEILQSQETIMKVVENQLLRSITI